MIKFEICKDFEQLILLHQKIFGEKNSIFFDNLQSKDYYKTFIATQDGSVIAYCIISQISDQAEIINIGVDKNFRNRGIAKKLLNFSIENIDAKEIFLEVSTNNLAAIGLYESVGFQEIDRRKKYYGDIDAIIMKKTKDL